MTCCMMSQLGIIMKTKEKKKSNSKVEDCMFSYVIKGNSCLFNLQMLIKRELLKFSELELNLSDARPL